MNAALSTVEAARLAGIELIATAEGNLRWRCPGTLPDELRQALAEHKVEVVARLLALEATRVKDAIGWADDEGTRLLQWAGSDAIDAAWERGDWDGVRQAVADFLTLFPSDTKPAIVKEP